MQNYLLIYSHPNPKSFNHSIKEKIASVLRSKGKNVEVRDLYVLGFDPVLSAGDFSQFADGKTPPDIAKEQEYIKKADALIFIYPVWWFGLPSILKGYIDRVFSKGFAYDYAGKMPRGLLVGKKVMVFSTTGGPKITYFLGGYKSALDKTITSGIFKFCGMDVIFHKFFYAVPIITEKKRKLMLDSIENLI